MVEGFVHIAAVMFVRKQNFLASLFTDNCGLCSCTGNRPRIAHCYARRVKQLSLVNECTGLERDCARDHNDVSAASSPRNMARYAHSREFHSSFPTSYAFFIRSKLSVYSTELVFRNEVIIQFTDFVEIKQNDSLLCFAHILWRDMYVHVIRLIVQ